MTARYLSIILGNKDYYYSHFAIEQTEAWQHCLPQISESLSHKIWIGIHLRVYILSPCAHLPSSGQAIISDLATWGSPKFEGTGLAQYEADTELWAHLAPCILSQLDRTWKEGGVGLAGPIFKQIWKLLYYSKRPNNNNAFKHKRLLLPMWRFYFSHALDYHCSLTKITVGRNSFVTSQV